MMAILKTVFGGCNLFTILTAPLVKRLSCNLLFIIYELLQLSISMSFFQMIISEFQQTKGFLVVFSHIWYILLIDAGKIEGKMLEFFVLCIIVEW